MPFAAGRPLLQIPGPTNCPLTVLAAIAQPTIDHRGPEFRDLALSVLGAIRPVFGTRQPVIIYPASGTGAWEAALANTLSPGDRVLMAATGHFATLWSRLATRLGLAVELIPSDWRSGVDASVIEARLRDDRGQTIRAVALVHNETSTGLVSDIPAARRAIDAAGHPALLLVDTISSLASMDYRHDDWGVDVTVGGSQKGLMLPPGLSFNAVSEKALRASRSARMPRAYWDWQDMLEAKVSLALLAAEGLDAVFARHAQAAAATRRCVGYWGFEIQARHVSEASASLTAVRLPDGHSADRLRALVLARSSVSLGNGLGVLADRVFRIGHLGDFNAPALLGALAAIEMGLDEAGIPHRKGGVAQAMSTLANPA
jgi:alanine-glyoxylate transaminase/serine-glyoxylate transaminase/serine-pyruvate transaminase